MVGYFMKRSRNTELHVRACLVVDKTTIGQNSDLDSKREIF